MTDRIHHDLSRAAYDRILAHLVHYYSAYPGMYLTFVYDLVFHSTHLTEWRWTRDFASFHPHPESP